MDFPPEHVFQEIDSDNCGPCCLEMIYKIKNKTRSIKDILRDWSLPDKGRPTFPAQLARDLNNNGIKTKLIVSNPRVVSPAWFRLPKNELIENIKLWLTIHSKHDWRTFGLHLLFYLQEGGEVEFKTLSPSVLKEKVNKESLLILGLDEVWIWGHRIGGKEHRIDDINQGTTGHFVLVRSVKNEKYEVWDPYPTNLENKHGVYCVDGDELVNSLLIWSGSIVEILA